MTKPLLRQCLQAEIHALDTQNSALLWRRSGCIPEIRMRYDKAIGTPTQGGGSSNVCVVNSKLFSNRQTKRTRCREPYELSAGRDAWRSHTGMTPMAALCWNQVHSEPDGPRASIAANIELDADARIGQERRCDGALRPRQLL